MNVFIMTDLEGISGVSSMSHITEVGSDIHRFACERLMADTNAAVEGAIRAGAEKVYVCDGHGGSNSFIDELLDKRAIKVKPMDFSKVIHEDKEIGAYLQVGAHAMPGTLNGFLDHAQSSATWYNYKINGTCYGELVMGGLFVGTYGIPCVMVSGDEAVCDEARMCFGDKIACAAVKKGIGRNHAECMDLKKAEELICKAAEDGVRRAGEIAPFTLSTPLTVTLEFMRSDFCDERYAARPDTRRLDARTLEMTVNEIVNYGDILFW